MISATGEIVTPWLASQLEPVRVAWNTN